MGGYRRENIDGQKSLVEPAIFIRTLSPHQFRSSRKGIYLRRSDFKENLVKIKNN